MLHVWSVRVCPVYHFIIDYVTHELRSLASPWRPTTASSIILNNADCGWCNRPHLDHAESGSAVYLFINSAVSDETDRPKLSILW